MEGSKRAVIMIASSDLDFGGKISNAFFYSTVCMFWKGRESDGAEEAKDVIVP